jgi:hypothetical protein
LERSLIRDYEYFHSSNIYGFGGRHLPFLLPHILALRPHSLIDYGAGRSDIAYRLGAKAQIERIACFDPAVPARAALPARTFDLLISLDVLEHIPEEEMDTVLAEMAGLARHMLLVIDIAPATAVLSDGRNAHVSLHDEAWWQARLARFVPAIRPVPIRRRNRVAFKSWDAALPPWRHAWIERREAFLLWGRKRLNPMARRQRRQRRLAQC